MKVNNVICFMDNCLPIVLNTVDDIKVEECNFFGNSMYCFCPLNTSECLLSEDKLHILEK